MPVIRNAQYPGKKVEAIASRSREYNEGHPINRQIAWFLDRTGMHQSVFARSIGYNGTFFDRMKEGRLQDRTIHKIRQFMKHYRA